MNGRSCLLTLYAGSCSIYHHQKIPVDAVQDCALRSSIMVVSRASSKRSSQVWLRAFGDTPMAPRIRGDAAKFSVGVFSLSHPQFIMSCSHFETLLRSTV